uniref:Uncharacterized protein n=1 Tax=Pseudomonas phage RVTF4 TaxID=3236931 RepID=A0AB39CDF5_9VIRU
MSGGRELEIRLNAYGSGWVLVRTTDGKRRTFIYGEVCFYNGPSIYGAGFARGAKPTQQKMFSILRNTVYEAFPERWLTSPEWQPPVKPINEVPLEGTAMSVEFNTPVEKLLHKTRVFLRNQAEKNKAGRIRKSVKGEGFKLKIDLQTGGGITIEATGGERDCFNIFAFHNGKDHLAFNGSSRYDSVSGSQTKPMRDREIHYLLRTWLKAGLGADWSALRAPLRKTETKRAKIIKGENYRVSPV